MQSTVQSANMWRRSPLPLPSLSPPFPQHSSSTSSSAWEEDSVVLINKLKGEARPYYSVLIDHRDFPFIVSCTKFSFPHVILPVVLSTHIQKLLPSLLMAMISLSTLFLVKLTSVLHPSNTPLPISPLSSSPSLLFSSLPSSPSLGLDYVAHEDVLPYAATGQEPFKHELFNQFLQVHSSDEGTHISHTLPLMHSPLFSPVCPCPPSHYFSCSLYSL